MYCLKLTFFFNKAVLKEDKRDKKVASVRKSYSFSLSSVTAFCCPALSRFAEDHLYFFGVYYLFSATQNDEMREKKLFQGFQKIKIYS